MVGNTGPYGTHGFTVQSVTGQRGLSEYNCPAKRYTADVAYTNRPVAGAFRGYGAPQALFALESPHGRHRARSRARPDRAAAEELGAHGRPARHPPGARRAGRHGDRPGEHAAGDELRHRRVRRAGHARDRLGAPQRPGVEATAGPAEHPAGDRLRPVHAGDGHPQPRHGRLLDQDERRRVVQPAGRRHRPRHRCRHRPRPDRRRGARRARRTTSSCTPPTPT